MDLPSMAKVTKLSIEVLRGEGEVDAGVRAGPVQSRADGRRSRDLGRMPISLADQLEALLAGHAGCAVTGGTRSARSAAAG